MNMLFKLFYVIGFTITHGILCQSSVEILEETLQLPISSSFTRDGVRFTRATQPKKSRPGENTEPPLSVMLKSEPQEILEVDCVEAMFMSPFHVPVTFFGNSSTSTRFDPTCRWSFIGTEACIPMLSCSLFDLEEPNAAEQCVHEYLEVFDGNTGIKRYCGKVGPVNVSAAEDLRDLFVTFKTRNKTETKEDLFTCTVRCSSRGLGQNLPLKFQPEIDPSCKCGNKPNNDRIVNGENATRGEFPWMVALVEAKTRQPFCGASIINDRMILTAAHCFKGKFLDYKNIDIILNGHIFDTSYNLNVVKERPQSRVYDPETLKALDAGNSSIRLKVQEIIVHPLYISETNDFDVGLILLAESINFTTAKSTWPVCLPILGSYLRTFAQKQAVVAGWGLPAIDAVGTPNILQKLTINVFSPKECKNYYAHRVNRRMMCAGYNGGGKDSCSGDSGGPLIVEDRTKVWYQIGTVSWGESCALAGNPGVYFRTTESGQWLTYQSNLNKAVWCAVP